MRWQGPAREEQLKYTEILLIRSFSSTRACPGSCVTPDSIRLAPHHASPGAERAGR